MLERCMLEKLSLVFVHTEIQYSFTSKNLKCVFVVSKICKTAKSSTVELNCSV